MPRSNHIGDWPDLLVGSNFEIRKVRHIIGLVGPRRATVLITGESGTGKELAAKALHQASPRASGPWVAVNCGALPEHLLEDELFGHIRGAFTNAVQNRVGRFEQASGGTLFLDEIGELPLELQAKLLRVLQEREFQRLGSSETVRADVRVIAATNADLPKRVARREFREDLYYRINVVPLPMPALRNRLSDIPELAGHLLRRICDSERIPMKSLDPSALAQMQAYSWPGNVRQLENALEAADALSGTRTVLTAEDFPLPESAAPALEDSSYEVQLPDRGLDYERTLAGIERGILAQALRRTGGNKKAAAEMLGLKRTTLAAKVRSLESMGCSIGY